MLLALLVLVPGLLAAVIFRALLHRALSTVDFFVYGAIFAFFITSFCFGIVYLRGFGDMQVQMVFGNLRSIVKYCVIATVAAIALPNCLYLLLQIWVKRKHDER